MGRNENVTGVKAILRISVANYKASIWLLQDNLNMGQHCLEILVIL